MRRQILLLALVAALAGCGGSGSGGSDQPSALEQKVAQDAGAIDPTRVHCRATKHSFEGEPLASCSFDDGTGGCYDANTGQDLTVEVRARFNAAQRPECWQ